MLRLIFSLCVVLATSAQGQFGDPPPGGENSRSQIIVEATQVAPGDSFYFALDISHPDHWHSYFENPGSLGTPPALRKWTDLPEGFTVSETIFPIPHVTPTGDNSALLYGYEGDVTFLYKVTAPADLAPGETFTFTGKAEWQICKVQCKFESQEISFTIKSGAETILDPAQTDYFKNALSKLPSDSEGWSAEVTEEENTFTFTATAPEGVTPTEPVYYFATDQQVDSQSEQDVTIDGRTITIKMPRNVGNEAVFIDAAEVLDTFTGLLTYHTAEGEQGVTLTTSLNADASVAADTGEQAAFIPATDEERAAGAAVYDPEAKPKFVLLGGEEEKSVTFLSSLGLVFLGGLFLNLMPCVFPVLGLKVMGFVAQAGEDESKIKKHGLAFGLGLLVTMWILALVIISLDLNWGQQLSNPIFLGSIILLLFVMGLNLFGLFEIGTSLTSVGGELQSKKGYSGSFFSGALTTLIATPCSGPFLGAVMGFALSQSKLVALAIFTVFALGIAAPYIILSFFPALIKKLPRPGAWMESFKQLMAFAIFATVAFFMKSYLKLVGIDSFTLYLYALVFVSLAAYIYGRWGTPMKKPKQRYISGYGIAGLFAILGGVMAFNSAKLSVDSAQTAHKVGNLSWNEWYPGRMELSRPKNRIVWIDYTADW